MMNEKIISKICFEYFAKAPKTVERCAAGQGNYVYIVECNRAKYVIRCSMENGAYDNSIYWLRKLAWIGIPVPSVITRGKCGKYEYLILSYLEGKDIGFVYRQLEDEDKRTIAKEIVCIQKRVSTLELKDVEQGWSWLTFINDMLERARNRIVQNGYFDAKKVEQLRGQLRQMEAYFASVKPLAYLDDISSKNLLIHNGRISGIIDIDWIGIGDKLTFAALTYMAFLNLEYDTDYVKYILEEMRIDEVERRAFLFYTLMYCVDFMGERGMQFTDKTIEVNEQIINRLNNIYDMLWYAFRGCGGPITVTAGSDAEGRRASP